MNKFCSIPLFALIGVLLLFAMGCGGAEATVIPTEPNEPTQPAEAEAPTEPAVPTEPAATPAATRGEMLQSLTANVILPGYTAAADALAQFSRSVDSLCASPTDAALNAARDDWREARHAWLATESYRFGPAMDRRSISMVDWWPIDAEKIERNLGDEDPVNAERVTEFLSATQRGFSTAEYLLFGADSAGLADGSSPQHCAYLQAVATVNSEEVSGILADWQGSGEAGGYAGYFDGTGSLALVDSDAEAEVVRTLVFQVRAIANMRLGAALGIDTQADDGAIPTGAADNSREDLLSQLEGIAAVYSGGEGGMGLSARVAAVSAETDARMHSAIESTISATRALEGSVISQVNDDPAKVRAVYDSMKELQRVLNTEIVSLLGVSVGFSDTDGDS